MFSQRVLLRVMLISLAIAAVLGAASVLFGATDVMWRTIGTLVLVGFSALIILAVTTRLSAPDVRLASQVAVLLVAIEFLLCLSLIWNFAQILAPGGDAVAQTMAALAGAGIPAVVCLRFICRPNASVAAITGLIVCIIVFAIWMIGVAFDAHILQIASGQSSWQWYEDGHAFGAMGILAALCLIGVGNDRWHWRWAGVGCALCAAAIMIYASHSNLSDLPEPTGWLIAAAVIAAHANLALRCPLAPHQKWLAYTTIAAVAATGFFVNLAVATAAGTWFRTGNPDAELLGRLAAAFAILSACGTLSLAIMARMNVRPKAVALTSLDNLPISVICPICRRKQTLTPAGGTCAGCGLKMNVKLEPPTCPTCGYSLLMLKTNRCPECGTTQYPSPLTAMQ